MVIGVVLLFVSLCCIYCLCTRRIMWKRKPGSRPDEDNLEIVCASREAVSANTLPNPTSPTSPSLSVRMPVSNFYSGEGVGAGGGMGASNASAATGAGAMPYGATATAPSSSGVAASLPLVVPTAVSQQQQQQGAPGPGAPGGPPRGQSFSSNDGASFLKACSEGQVDIVMAALQANPDLALARDGETGHSVFMKAIRGKNLEVLKALTRLNPEAINAGDKNQASPIHHAVVYQAIDMIQVLVGAGGSLAAKDKNGETPLDLAKKLFKKGTHKTEDVIKALEGMGAA